MNMPIKAVLFDLDGVTINTEPLYTLAEFRLFKEYGITIPKEDLHIFRGCSEKTFYDLSMARYGISEDRTVFIQKGRKYVQDEFQKNIPFISGFRRLISRLVDRYKTGLVTASPIHTLNMIREKLKLDQYFQEILSGDELEKNKPYPDPYQEMMRRLCVKKNNTIIIEDSIQGLRAAISSGAHVIAISGSVPRQELKIAHKIIDHLDEINAEMIENLLLDPL